MFNKRINIFTGHFGSGKTEVAVNFAIQLRQLYPSVSIVDFDIVNPYFRTADACDALEEKGIWVILPMYANTNVDVPALPPAVNTLFEKKEYRAVLDVGGDDLGARALARYREEILTDDYEMFFVVNTRRPMTDSVEKIEEMIGQIEHSSRIKATRLVNNTNLLGDTTVEDLLRGQEMVSRVSEKLKIPMGFTSGMKAAVEGLSSSTDGGILILDKYIRLPWDK